LREGHHLKKLSVDEKIVLKLILEEWDGRARTGLIWLRIGTGGRFL
jgi:hypothetical protein